MTHGAGGAGPRWALNRRHGCSLTGLRLSFSGTLEDYLDRQTEAGGIDERGRSRSLLPLVAVSGAADA